MLSFELGESLEFLSNWSWHSLRSVGLSWGGGHSYPTMLLNKYVMRAQIITGWHETRHLSDDGFIEISKVVYEVLMEKWSSYILIVVITYPIGNIVWNLLIWGYIGLFDSPRDEVSCLLSIEHFDRWSYERFNNYLFYWKEATARSTANKRLIMWKKKDCSNQWLWSVSKLISVEKFLCLKASIQLFLFSLIYTTANKIQNGSVHMLHNQLPNVYWYVWYRKNLIWLNVAFSTKV